MHAHDHEHDADHDHGGHEGELFPRQQIAQLVGSTLDDGAQRAGFQALLIGAGLAVLALGLPAEALFSQSAHGVVDSVASVRCYPGLTSAFVALVTGLGIALEPALYLLAALAAGSACALGVSCLRSIGTSPVVAVLATLVGYASFGAWSSASAPVDYALELVVATAALRLLFSASAPQAACSIVALSILDASALWLLPLALFADASSRESVGIGAKLGALLAVGLMVVSTTQAEPWQRWLADLWPGSMPSVAALLALGQGLGLGWIALGLLFFAPRTPEEAPAPRWLWGFVAIALLRAVTSPDPLLASAWLAPVAALGLADFATRRHSPVRGLVVAGLAALIQLGLTSAFVVQREAQASESAWREQARTELEPTDVWISSDWRRNYIAGTRFGLTLAAPSVADSIPAGRVVLDGELERSPELLEALAGRDVWTLESGALRRDP